MELTVDSLLTQADEAKASDVHLRVNSPPVMRVDGTLVPMPGRPVLDADMVQKLVGSILDDQQIRQFSEHLSIDLSHAVPGVGRFRVNFFIQMGFMGGVFRRIPERIPTLAELAAPLALVDFARRPRGLVLVTGPTGSGKSTTLAAVLNLINTERAQHILTIEDPVEFVHTPKRSLINQREIGRDVISFATGLRAALRQDPDVILVGEMRDQETIATAITAAETGHLVFGTLHTSSAPSTIDRIVDVFPAGQQEQIRAMLAVSMVGVVTQTLLPRADGKGRVAAHEVMIANTAIRAQIRHGQASQMRGTIQTHTKIGMQTMDQALAYLVTQGVVSEDVASEKAQDLNEFERIIKNFREGKAVASPRLVTEEHIVSMDQAGGGVKMVTSSDTGAPAPLPDGDSSASAAGELPMPPAASSNVPKPVAAPRAAAMPMPESAGAPGVPMPSAQAQPIAMPDPVATPMPSASEAPLPPPPPVPGLTPKDDAPAPPVFGGED